MYCYDNWQLLLCCDVQPFVCSHGQVSEIQDSEAAHQGKNSNIGPHMSGSKIGQHMSGSKIRQHISGSKIGQDMSGSKFGQDMSRSILP